jgi:hypothetical protein
VRKEVAIMSAGDIKREVQITTNIISMQDARVCSLDCAHMHFAGPQDGAECSLQGKIRRHLTVFSNTGLRYERTPYCVSLDADGVWII